MNYYKPTDEQIIAARHHFFIKGYPYPLPEKQPLRELNDSEKEILAEKRAAVHAMGKDAVDFMGELHKAGLIDGWRSLDDVVLFNESPSTGSGQAD